jgi:adenine-specific DNA-methyltransferase
MSNFVQQPMITYIGNKRKLIQHIEDVVERLKPSSAVDAFSGSGVVSRMLLTHSDTLYVNDLEKYCEVLSECFLKTPSLEDQREVRKHIDIMNNLPEKDGFISELYAPNNSNEIQEDERCFYTKENAGKIDAMIQYVHRQVPEKLRPYCMGPLLVKSSIHTNTSGVFKGFHKGGWGGKKGHALDRITGEIKIECPVWHEVPKNVSVHRKDVFDFLEGLPKVDLIYLDPPYNQHPYGSNYFMLNLIATNKRPKEISKVSGIPTDWNKSPYNSRTKIIDTMRRTLELSTQKATYTLVSYNNEGFIRLHEWEDLLKSYKYERIDIDYNCYRGSRNLQNRPTKVTEFLFLISSS